MNKLLKTTLISAIFATSGFATTSIAGTQDIIPGGIFRVQNSDCTLTGTMTLAGSDTEGKNIGEAAPARLIVEDGRIFDVKDSTLTYDGLGTYKPGIILNGTMKISPDINNVANNLSVKLDNVKIEGRGVLKITNKNDEEEIYTIKNISKINGTDVVNTINYMNNLELSFIKLDQLYYTSNQALIGWEPLANYSGWYVRKSNPETFITYSAGSISNTDKVNSMFQTKNEYQNDYRIEQNSCLDMSELFVYSEIDTEGQKTATDFRTRISGIAPEALESAKLPFNCKFSNINLSNVNKVEYTTMEIGASTGPGISSLKYNNTTYENVIQKVTTKEAVTYGDYATTIDLGVQTPNDSSKLDITKKFIEETHQKLILSELTADQTYNQEGNKLYLVDMDADDSTMTISKDTTYNFGFIGGGYIGIDGSGKAILKGDNSGYYAPDDTLSFGKDITVEFAGNNSLFQHCQTYGRGIFTSGEITNQVTGISTFTKGIEIESGHTLKVSGTLVV